MRNELTKPKKRKKRRPYPPKYQEERTKLIKKTQPWRHSTGPRTDEGKAKAAQNAHKHGLYGAEITALRAALRAQSKYINAISAGFSSQNE